MMQISLNMLQVAGESGLRFGDHNVESAKLRIRQHSLEFRPRVKKPALIVIGIDVYDLAVMCKRIVCQQKPLILDAGAVVSLRQLIFVLL